MWPAVGNATPPPSGLMATSGSRLGLTIGAWENGGDRLELTSQWNRSPPNDHFSASLMVAQTIDRPSAAKSAAQTGNGCTAIDDRTARPQIWYTSARPSAATTNRCPSG